MKCFLGCNTTQKVEYQFKEAKMRNKSLTISLWEGEEPLASTFWGFYITPLIIMRTMENKILNLLLELSNNAITFYILLLVIWSVFMLISIWNSANNYQGSIIWHILAKVVVVLHMLKLFVDINTLIKAGII